jgi:glycerol-3-phosphate acyltransferase PlsY
MDFLLSAFAIVLAYLLGSIPSGLIVSRLAKGVDIRTIGDGNMGARNTSRSLGVRYGIIVGLADFCKGALAVLLARVFGLGIGIQMLAGAAAVLGHDFPIFAGFKGGQGLATTGGTLLVLFPMQTLIGAIVYGLLFLITRKSDLGASIGCGLTALMLGIQQEWAGLVYIVMLLLSIPMKKLIDTSRRKVIDAVMDKKSQV